MATELRFLLELESDWHVNAGYGQGAQVDAVLQRDDDGLPVITGSTLKGLFRDALYELFGTIQKNKDAYSPVELNGAASIADRILGSPGIEGNWTFGTARPAELPHRITLQGQTGSDMAAVVTGVRVSPRTRRAEEGKFYRREMGQAAQFVFTARSNAADARVADDALWLAAAAAYIRHLGGRRRRGAGRCRIRLQDDTLHKSLLNNFGAVYCKQGSVTSVHLPQTEQPTVESVSVKNRRFRVWVWAQRPVVISESPEAGNVYHGRADIPGRALRGAFAYRVSENQRDSADFRNLFVLGGAQFTNLAPVVFASGKAAIISPTPMGIQEHDDKAHPYRSILTATPGKAKGYEKSHLFADHYPKMEGTDAKQTYMHVRIDPTTKRADEGNLFAYEAGQSGSYYVGEIVMSSGGWQKFAGLLKVNPKTPFDLYMGKGRKRGYGHCLVWIEPMDDAAAPTAMALPLKRRTATPTPTITLTLLSDTIILDTWGRFVRKFNADWLAEALGVTAGDVTVEQQAVRTRLIQGFDMRAGLPQWWDIALAAGSSAKITIRGGITPAVFDKLRELELYGFGLRCAEGFGRIVVNHPAHSDVTEGFEPMAVPEPLLSQEMQLTLRSQFTKEWRQQVEQIINKKWDLGAALARSLVQHADSYTAASELVENFGKSPEQGQYHDKQNRFTSDQRKTILRLLEQLHTQYGAHWRSGVVILAETLAKRSAEK